MISSPFFIGDYMPICNKEAIEMIESLASSLRQGYMDGLNAKFEEDFESLLDDTVVNVYCAQVTHTPVKFLIQLHIPKESELYKRFDEAYPNHYSNGMMTEIRGFKVWLQRLGGLELRVGPFPEKEINILKFALTLKKTNITSLEKAIKFCEEQKSDYQDCLERLQKFQAELT